MIRTLVVARKKEDAEALAKSLEAVLAEKIGFEWMIVSQYHRGYSKENAGFADNGGFGRL